MKITITIPEDCIAGFPSREQRIKRHLAEFMVWLDKDLPESQDAELTIEYE